MTIKEYINNNFGGNISMCARAVGVDRTSLYYLLKHPPRKKTQLFKKFKRLGIDL